MELKLQKYVGSILGHAIGDSLGMATESMTRQDINKKFGVLKEHQAGNLTSGSYTDDTQQSMILIESLLENNGLDTKKYMGQLIKDTDPGRGIGPTLYKFLIASMAANEPQLDMLKPIYPSNGLAMKVNPVSLFYHNQPRKINSVVKELSNLTHRHEGSLAGAIAIAQSIDYVLNNDNLTFSKDDFLSHVVEQTAIYDLKMAKIIKSSEIFEDMYANSYSTVPNAILTFANGPCDFENGIIQLVNSGGDTDTKAAMYGAISGAFNGVDAIPKRWIEGLENGKKGKDYLVDLAHKLFNPQN